MVRLSAMKLLVRWRERRISWIERRVDELTDQINRAWTRSIQEEDPALAKAYEELAEILEEQRKHLWFRRSDLVKKQPPTYEGDSAP